jgi:DNA replication protein DnaC
VEFSLLLQDLRAGFDRGAPTAELMAPLLSVDVLAIDELGKGRNTEWETVVLDELVSRRYNAMGTLLGTTNFAPRSTGVAVPNLAAARDASAGAAGLADRVGDRVFSRLSEMVRFEPIIAPDFRAQGPARPHGNG